MKITELNPSFVIFHQLKIHQRHLISEIVGDIRFVRYNPFQCHHPPKLHRSEYQLGMPACLPARNACPPIKSQSPQYPLRTKHIPLCVLCALARHLQLFIVKIPHCQLQQSLSTLIQVPRLCRFKARPYAVFFSLFLPYSL